MKTGMSLEMAIGQIDQIMNLQQELDDPSAFASTLASGGVGSTSGTAASSSGGAGLTTSSDSAQFANMLAANQASAITGTDDTSQDTGLTGTGLSDSLLSALTGSSGTSTTGLTGTDGASGLGTATAATNANASSQVQAMTDQANSLLGKPYVWGGGHSGWGPQAGYDCSGFVSAVLHAGGYLSSPQDTQTLPAQPGIENGPGQYVTIYDRTDAGSGNDHVIIDIAGQFYESGGGHGAWGGGGGVEKIAQPSQAYLDSFNRVLHPEGL
jgi:cell wall-associated NlpC family hydrolase